MWFSTERRPAEHTARPAGSDDIGNFARQPLKVFPPREKRDARKIKRPREITGLDRIALMLGVEADRQGAYLELHLAPEGTQAVRLRVVSTAFRGAPKHLIDCGPEHDELFLLEPERHFPGLGTREQAEGTVSRLSEGLSMDRRDQAEVQLSIVHNVIIGTVYQRYGTGL